MFIRSSTAINDCLIALDVIECILKGEFLGLQIKLKSNKDFFYDYESQEARDKAFDELCAYLTSNYKLRDFT